MCYYSPYTDDDLRSNRNVCCTLYILYIKMRFTTITFLFQVLISCWPKSNIIIKSNTNVIYPDD